VDPIDWASELSKAKADIEAALGTGPDSATRQPLFFDVTELLAGCRSDPDAPVGGISVRSAWLMAA
jgi:hypothetical protein